MDERAALSLVADAVGTAGDDAAVLDDTVVTTDMLHERTDFPEGTTRYTAGWRAVGASLSDVAAMGASARAGLAVYGAPEFEREELSAFLRGAREVCEAVDGEYVGGDLDAHREFTVATTAVGHAADPVYRTGAAPGDRVCVTGHLGRSGAAIELFERGARERANELFRFLPRVEAGVAIAPHASAMMDVSDGLARSLHQLGEASDCGFAVESDPIPVDDAVEEVAADADHRRELSLFFGEDFELLCTVPPGALSAVRESTPVPIADVGEVVESGGVRVQLDGDVLPDRGYTH